MLLGMSLEQNVKLCNEAKTRALLQGGWRRYNIFEGLSRSEIGIAVTLGTLSAVVVALILTSIVYLLPIADKLKISVLFLLGLVSICAGHCFLISMAPNSQQRNPDPIISNTHLEDPCSTSKGIKKNFSQSSKMPYRATAISSPPSMKRQPAKNPLPIFNSLVDLLGKIRHRPKDKY
jgi:hypothetical protein